METCLKTRLERIGGARACLSPEYGIEAEMHRVRTGMAVRFELVCDTNIFGPYLDIEPKILWIADWGAENDVYSNTNWNVD